MCKENSYELLKKLDENEFCENDLSALNQYLSLVRKLVYELEDLRKEVNGSMMKELKHNGISRC